MAGGLLASFSRRTALAAPTVDAGGTAMRSSRGFSGETTGRTERRVSGSRATNTPTIRGAPIANRATGGKNGVLTTRCATSFRSRVLRRTSADQTPARRRAACRRISCSSRRIDRRSPLASVSGMALHFVGGNPSTSMARRRPTACRYDVCCDGELRRLSMSRSRASPPVQRQRQRQSLPARGRLAW